MTDLINLLDNASEWIAAAVLAVLLLLFVPIAPLGGRRKAGEHAGHLDPGLREELEGLNRIRDVDPDDTAVVQSLDELRGLMSRDFEFDARGELNLRGVFADRSARAARPAGGAADRPR